MKTWPVQDAKARFSEFLEACITDGPQIVTKRGAAAAVLVPWESGGDSVPRRALQSSSCCCRMMRVPNR